MPSGPNPSPDALSEAVVPTWTKRLRGIHAAAFVDAFSGEIKHYNNKCYINPCYTSAGFFLLE